MSSFVDRALEILSGAGENKRNLQAFEEHLRYFVPFAGAGLSMPMGYPGWGKLLLELAPGKQIRKGVETLVKHAKFEEAASEIAENLTPKALRDAIAKQFGDNGKALVGAVTVLPSAAPDLVITTNLDSVLERAFAAAGKTFNTVFHGGDVADASGAIQRRKSVLIKLHGTFGDPDSWILTLKQYAAAYGEPKTDLERPVPKLLRQALGAKPLLFLGCSLQTDRTLRVISESVHGISTEHFALLAEDGNNTGPRLEQFRQWNIKALFYRDGHGKVEEFLRFIAETVSAPPGPGAQSAGNTESIESIVKRARAAVYDSVKTNCGFMKILDMTQRIDLGAIYTEVNIHPNRASSLPRGGVERQRIGGEEAAHGNQRLAIYGQPGSGETTLLKRIANECVEGRQMPDLVPLFVVLANFESGTLLSHAEALHPGLPWQRLLTEGRGLVLLDGLDEVKDFERVRKAVVEFVTHYPKTRVLMTCRISARAYNFEQFTDVEMADFGEPQIRAFATKFFEAHGKRDRCGPFLKRLDNSNGLRDLATKPLLLTLLCLIFDERGEFDGSRARLYEVGIDTLVRKWDRSRGIERQRWVPVDMLLELLEHLAYDHFVRSETSFGEPELLREIEQYFEARPSSPRASATTVLQEAQAAAGLIAERARGTFAFSHLTFQEYLTALHIVKNSSRIQTDAERYIGDSRWREVWLMVSEKLNPADLLPVLKLAIDGRLSKDANGQEVLDWCHKKASAARSSRLRLPARRSLYFWLFARDLDIALLALARDHALFARNRALALTRALDFARNRSLDYAHALAAEGELDLALDLCLVAALRVGQWQASRELVTEATAFAKRRGLEELEGQLEPLLKRISPREEAHVSSSLRQVALRHRDIGREWNLSIEQWRRLAYYLAANLFLMDLMNESAARLPAAIRKQLEDEMLLPWAHLRSSSQRPGTRQSTM